ncbi:MAG: hypothetical protein IKZ99_13195 [Salinivirgaceae bacterium]|nr:hypothetical protein [Salinivirgaceae bacterium]
MCDSVKFAGSVRGRSVRRVRKLAPNCGLASADGLRNAEGLARAKGTASGMWVGRWYAISRPKVEIRSANAKGGKIPDTVLWVGSLRNGTDAAALGL